MLEGKKELEKTMVHTLLISYNSGRAEIIVFYAVDVQSTPEFRLLLRILFFLLWVIFLLTHIL